MPIEALYPYAIMTYSALVTILAVYLWKLTNLNVDGTRHNIEKQVATAVTDITSRLDAKLEEFDMPEFDTAPITAQLEALQYRLTEIQTEFPNTVGQHVSMAIKGVQATEAKHVAAYVESLNIEGLTEEMKEAAIEKLTLTQRIAHELLTMKIPPKTKRERPLSTMVFEQSRGLVAQAILEREAGAGNVHVEGRPSGRGGSFNPGYNP